MWKPVIIWGTILILSVLTGFLFYPPENISIPLYEHASLGEPLSFQNFAASFLGIPSAIKDYEVRISYEPPLDCVGKLFPWTYAAFTMEPDNPLVPYAKQAFATTSCMNIWPNTKGLNQYEGGLYNFCLPAGSQITFTYPANTPIFIATPPIWEYGSCSMNDENGGWIDLTKYTHAYASPLLGELVVGWVGVFLAWVVIVGSMLSVWDVSMRPRK